MHVERIHISAARGDADLAAFCRRLRGISSVQAVELDPEHRCVMVRMHPVLGDIQRVKHLARYLQTGMPLHSDAHRLIAASA